MSDPAKPGPIRLLVMLIAVVAVALTAWKLTSDQTESDPQQQALLDSAAPPSDPLLSNTATDDAQEANPLRIIEQNIEMLQTGLERIEDVPQYQARLYRQERVGSELSDPQLIDFRVRHEPFSVYMKWLTGDEGQEVLYVDGKHDGKMLVKLGGWKARFTPVLEIDPNGATALSNSRHPVTDAGLLALCHRLVEDRQADLKRGSGVQAVLLEDQECNGRDCDCFVFTWEKPGLCQDYRKSIQYFDRELRLPICVRNFAWPENAERLEATETEAQQKLDEQTLVEVYSYLDLNLDFRIADTEFQRGHRSYAFGRE